MWFEVDKAGLGRLLERKGKPFILNELIQNALDEDTKRVTVTLERVPGTRSVRLSVEDDNPSGFATLSHAFTLFADSKKKGDATKRGRFNLGEKLVLALCDEAEIRSTQGGFRFDDSGRHTIRAKREAGSVFTGVLKMTNDEMVECEAAVQCLLIPPGVEVTYNGDRVPERTPIKVIEATLPTEIADDEGRLRRTQRKTTIEFYEPMPDEEASLYELGIPVVATGDRYHVNVLQKVLLNFDRDNVRPGYLAQVRALTVANLTERLTVEDANSTWARDALERHGDELPDYTVHRLMDLRFGDKRVAYDPSDPESNSRAVAAGYVVVHGGQMSGPEWTAAKRVGAIVPAGKVLPTYKPYSEGGEPAKYVPEERWSEGMKFVAHAVRLLGQRLLDRSVLVLFESGRFTDPWAANYGGAVLTFNYERLRKSWFENGLNEAVLNLILHEFGHETEADHLSDRFNDALSSLGARLALLVANDDAVRALLERRPA